MIKVRAPRYRDRTVLLARYRLPAGQGVTVEIETGAYKGIYKVSNAAINNSPIEGMETRQGKIIAMRAVPLDAMERISNE